MEFVTLRRAGGSLTLTIPRTFVRVLGLSEGSKIGVSVADGKLIAEPDVKERPVFTLEELLAQCDASAALSAEDEAWISNAPTGSELI